MDFSSSGLNRHNHPSQSHHQQPVFRNSSVHPSLFGSSNYGQPSTYGNGSNTGNQFNFPLRSRQQLAGGNGSGGSSHYSNFRTPPSHDAVLRQTMLGPPTNQFQQLNLNKSPNKSSNSGSGNRNERFNGNNSTNGKQTNPRDKSEMAGNSASADSPQVEQQYRIFKRGDTIPGVCGPVQADSSTGPRVSPSSGSLQDIADAGSDVKPTETCANLNGRSSDTDNNDSNTFPTGKENQRSRNGPNTRTTVSLISELAKFHGLQFEYRLVKEIGPPHAPTFTVNLTLGSEEYQGCGSSIKRAQHAAATDAFENTSFLKPPPRQQQVRRTYNVGSATGQRKPNWALIQLTALAEEMKQPITFILQPMGIVGPFARRESSIVCAHVGDRVFTGEGHTFNAAKNTAAMIALKTLSREKQEMEVAKLLAEGTSPFQLEENNISTENKSPISLVHEMAMKRGLTVSFEVVSESGPPHMKVFTIQCIVGELITEGQGSTKQQAKKISSEMMMSKLKELRIPLPSVLAANSTLKAMQRGYSKQRITKKKTTPVLKDVDKHVSPISKLIQIAHAKKMKEPEFRLLEQPTEPNETGTGAGPGNKNDRRNKRKKTVFTIEVSVGPHICQGSGINKKSAKKAAADAALTALGCVPSSSDGLESSGAENNTDSKVTSTSSGFESSQNTKQEEYSNQSPSRSAQLTTPRQLVPGVLVVKNEASPPSPPIQSATVAQGLIKVNNSIAGGIGASTQESLNKLSYLAQLLDLKLSFSDFPKKDEFLSIVSFGGSPPQVAHGIGATLEEARNMAAQKILDELGSMGLDRLEVNGAGN